MEDKLYIATKEGSRREVGWAELTQLEKDILWVYDQHVGDVHNPFIPDNSYSLKYWEYLSLAGDILDERTQRFYRQGILIILLCMAIEYADTLSGNQRHFAGTEIQTIIDCVNRVDPMDPKEKKLRDCVGLALGIAKSMTEEDLNRVNSYIHPDLEILQTQLDWIDETFLRAYFRERAK